MVLGMTNHDGEEPKMHTSQTAIDFITQAIEAAGADVAKADEFDLDWIARDLRERTGSWDISEADHDIFWRTVERGAKVQNLYDNDTTSVIGVATPEHIEASRQAGDTGIILIDGDGDVIGEQDEHQPWVPQPVRRVYVEA